VTHICFDYHAMNELKIAEKNQHDQLQRLLIDEYALVHLNPKSEGVEVPEQFRNQEVLTLKLSKLYRGRLDIGKEVVTAELLFDEYHTCVIPLKIIWGMTSVKGETFIWPQAAPVGMQPAPTPHKTPAIVAKTAPALGAAPSSEHAGNATSDTADSATPKRKGHLTRIK
jgi:hypothetical protein